MLNYNKIYSLEVFDFLANIDDKCVDLAIIDPPYNLKVADWDTFESEKSFLNFCYAWIDGFLPKMKASGSFYIFNTSFNCALFLNYLRFKKVFFQNFITWYKKDGMSACKRRFNNNHESILFYTMNKSKYCFNCDDIRIPYLSQDRIIHAQSKGILKNGKRWFPNPKGRLCPDVWEITSQRHKEKVGRKIVKPKHPTIKPYEMIERIVKASSNENDVVLDLFAGSGIGLKVCQDLNRLYIGTDFNTK